MQIKTPKQQRGAVVLLFGILLLGTMTAILSFATLDVKNEYRKLDRIGGTRDQRIAVAKQRAESLYESLAATIDTFPNPRITAATFLRQAHIPAEWQVNLVIGTRHQQGGLAWRNLYLWIPPRNRVDTTQYNANTDQFTPDPFAKWATVNGATIQQKRLLRTREQMNHLAELLQYHFSAQYELDRLHNPNVNYFQKGVVNGGYLTLAQLGYDQLLGITQNDLLDGWGGNLLASNTVDAQTASPPYTMVLRAVTPWGGQINLTVNQP